MLVLEPCPHVDTNHLWGFKKNTDVGIPRDHDLVFIGYNLSIRALEKLLPLLQHKAEFEGFALY